MVLLLCSVLIKCGCTSIVFCTVYIWKLKKWKWKEMKMKGVWLQMIGNRSQFPFYGSGCLEYHEYIYIRNCYCLLTVLRSPNRFTLVFDKNLLNAAGKEGKNRRNWSSDYQSSGVILPSFSFYFIFIFLNFQLKAQCFIATKLSGISRFLMKFDINNFATNTTYLFN